jgi:hypothetical protein
MRYGGMRYGTPKKHLSFRYIAVKRNSLKVR